MEMCVKPSNIRSSAQGTTGFTSALQSFKCASIYGVSRSHYALYQVNS